jgi:hypothetical protein
MGRSPKSAKEPPRPGMKARIETQIHRRKKAKAIPPLEAEWDIESSSSPTHLRTPSENMRPSR